MERHSIIGLPLHPMLCELPSFALHQSAPSDTRHYNLLLGFQTISCYRYVYLRAPIKCVKQLTLHTMHKFVSTLT